MILSFVIAGAICACAALAYAEMATMIPTSGSAYTYSYVVLGEVIAWVIGWSLILEYSLVVSTVAVGDGVSTVEPSVAAPSPSLRPPLPPTPHRSCWSHGGRASSPDCGGARRPRPPPQAAAGCSR